MTVVTSLRVEESYVIAVDSAVVDGAGMNGMTGGAACVGCIVSHGCAAMVERAAFAFLTGDNAVGGIVRVSIRVEGRWLLFCVEVVS